MEAWLFLEPHTVLDHCLRILLSCFRARTSGLSLGLLIPIRKESSAYNAWSSWLVRCNAYQILWQRQQFCVNWRMYRVLQKDLFQLVWSRILAVSGCAESSHNLGQAFLRDSVCHSYNFCLSGSHRTKIVLLTPIRRCVTISDKSCSPRRTLLGCFSLPEVEPQTERGFTIEAGSIIFLRGGICRLDLSAKHFVRLFQ